MTVINLDDEVVATAYDPATRICTYTYQHPDGSRYTVPVHLDELAKLGTTPANRGSRRQYLAMKIQNHVATNKPDEG